ncbi:MAG TPA: hypothetical protein VJC12_02630 [Candidatus Paceibacterota bacterium]
MGEVLDWSLYRHSTDAICEYLRISFTDWKLMVSALSHSLGDEDKLDPESTARTRVANIHMYLHSSKFISPNVGRNWLEISQDFSPGRMNSMQAMVLGLMDEVLDKLRALPDRLKLATG